MVGITIKARKTRLQGSCSAARCFSYLLCEPESSRTSAPEPVNSGVLENRIIIQTTFQTTDLFSGFIINTGGSPPSCLIFSSSDFAVILPPVAATHLYRNELKAT